MEQRDFLSPAPNQNMQQNLPNATGALVLGIISIVGSFCYGIVGLVCGIIGLVLANRDKNLYTESPELYTQSSFGTSNAGRTCSIIGIVLSSLIIIVVIFYIVLIGSLISTQAFK
ncbi:MAG: CCC motif membrane protein [Ferruginibacter sp.]